MLTAVEIEEAMPRKRQSPVPLPAPLRDIRTIGLGMTQEELVTASKTILGKYGLSGVSVTAIIRAESYDPVKDEYGPIKLITASRLLMTINELYDLRGRANLTIDDIVWNIIDRKP